MKLRFKVENKTLFSTIQIILKLQFWASCMLIKRVKLHNIRSYLSQAIDFPSGSVLLSGDIGSGKSTILLAIEFALFGSDEMSGEALLRKGAAEASVELTIDVAGNEIVIKRGLKKAKGVIMQTPGWIMKNGERKDTMPTELKSEVIELLGYPEELVAKRRNHIYRYTVYCPQEDMKLILSDDKEARLGTLRRIFGIEKYKRIKENCAIITRELKTKQREMEARVEGMEEQKKSCKEKKEHLTAIHQRLAALIPLIQQLQEQVILKKKHLEKNEAEVKKVHDKKRDVDVLLEQEKFRHELIEKNELRIKQLMDIIQNARVSVNTLEQHEKELYEKVTAQKTLQQKITMLSQQALSLEKEIVSPDIEQKRMMKNQFLHELERKSDVEHRKEEAALHIQRLNSTLKEYEVKMAQAEEMKRNILQLATCPTCLQPVSKEHKEHVHAQEKEKAEIYSTKVKECREELRRKEEELLQHKMNSEHLNDVEKQLARLNAELNHLEEISRTMQGKKKAIDKIKAELEDSKKEALGYKELKLDEELRKVKEQIEKAKEQERAEKERSELKERNELMKEELHQLKEKRIMLHQDIDQLEFFEEKLKVLRKELDGFTAEERDASIQSAHLKSEKEAIEDMIKQLDDEIEKKEKNKKKSARILQLRTWLEEYFVNLMNTIEKHVMIRIHKEFNELFKKWFSVLIADESMMARVDDSFNPIIEQNGYDVDVGYLSGGERTSAALAYRLALNKVVNDVIETIKTKDILILDEPTDGFSSEQLDRVREVLDELGVKQVIIVSHESKVESFVGNTMHIVKEEGESRVN